MIPDDLPWYRDGLRFTCVDGCVACCTGAGDVWISDEEILAIAAHIGMPPDEFRATRTRSACGHTALADKPNEDCVFLGSSGCGVYPVRPRQCRQFPFWPDALASRYTWNALRFRCAGVAAGRLYSCDEIDAIRIGRADVDTLRGNV
jgi:uncharacterized protein